MGHQAGGAVKPVAVMVAPPAVLPVFDDGWKQQCTTCKHILTSNGPSGNTVMRCGVVYVPAGLEKRLWVKRGLDRAYCIDARDGACGPDAALWEAA